MVYDIQKASVWKRISAGLFDITMIAVVAILFGIIFSSIFGFDKYSARYDEIKTSYEQEYEIKFDKSDYDDLDEIEKALYDERYEEASDDLASNKEVISIGNLLNAMTLAIITLGILFAYIILEFIIPIIFKNGQTLGKKIFKICVVRKDCVRMNNISLFIRTFLGKFTIETMIPVLMIIMLYFGFIGTEALIVIGGILVSELLVMFISKDNLLIHDTLALTVACDIETQMIFKDEKELNEYKARVALDEVNHARY